MANAKNTQSESTNKSNRGFASMNEDRQREISSMGGKASHQSGKGNQFNSETGRAAGKLGGESRHASQNESNQARTEERGDVLNQ